MFILFHVSFPLPRGDADVIHTYKGLWKSCYRKDKDMLTSCQAVSEGLASGELKMACKCLLHFPTVQFNEM